MEKSSSKPIISILIPTRGSPVSFRNTVESFAKTCVDTSRVEFLIKTDKDTKDQKYVRRVFKEFPFTYEILNSPRQNGYVDLPRFFNDLAKLSNGMFLWLISDDVQIIQGNWVKEIFRSRGVISDNLFIAYAKFAISADKLRQKRFRETGNGCPIVTRELYDRLQCFSVNEIQCDVFLRGLIGASEKKRSVTIKRVIIAQMTDNQSRVRGNVSNYRKKNISASEYKRIAREIGI